MTLSVTQFFRNGQPNYKDLYTILYNISSSYTKMFIILTVSGVTYVRYDHGVMSSIYLILSLRELIPPSWGGDHGFLKDLTHQIFQEKQKVLEEHMIFPAWVCERRFENFGWPARLAVPLQWYILAAALLGNLKSFIKSRSRFHDLWRFFLNESYSKLKIHNIQITSFLGLYCHLTSK